MRVGLWFKVLVLRCLTRINAWLDRLFIHPVPMKPWNIVQIPTHRATRKGKIDLYFYTPPGYRGRSIDKHPLVVNFHGGGFTIGHPADDARWAHVVTSRTSAVVVSVGYRKAPEHSAPTAALDAADAIEWLWEHAAQYGLDPFRTVTTGSSAGGNLSLGAPLIIYRDELASRSNQQKYGAAPVKATRNGDFVGIIAFYPSTDQTIPREVKAASNPLSITHGSMPPALYALFDECYYTSSLPPSRREDVSLSPGLADDKIFSKGLPKEVALYTCEYDQLLVEAETLRTRLRNFGKVGSGYMVEKAPHGFDKPVVNHKRYGERAQRMREDALRVLKRMIEE